MTNGSTQPGRAPPALSPDSFQVDETPLSDLLSMTREYAGALTFVADDGRPRQTWADLFDRDVAVLMARGVSLRLDRRNLDLLDDFAGARTAEMAQHIRDLATWLGDWFRALWQAEGGLRDDGAFGKGVSGRLEQIVLRGLIPEMAALRLTPVTTVGDLESRLGEWLPEVPAPGAMTEPRRAPPTLRDMRRLYFALIEALERLQTVAAQELARSLDSQRHEPAAALLLAAAQAFLRVQHRINQFTARHLDFYYRECLGFTSLGASPDSAHLVFQRDQAFTGEVTIQAGQSFAAAGVTASGAPIEYRADDSLAVSGARVAELKTLRMERSPISPEREFGYVTRAKAATYAPDIGPEDLLERRTAPLMGGTVLGCIEDDQDARVGLAISSPVLWLKEGERHIDLTLEIDISLPHAPKRAKGAAQDGSSPTDGGPADDARPPDPKHGLMANLSQARDIASFYRALGDLFTAWLLSDEVVLTDADVRHIRSLPNLDTPYITADRLGEVPQPAFVRMPDESDEDANERSRPERDRQDDLAIFLAHDLLTMMLGEITPEELREPVVTGGPGAGQGPITPRGLRRLLARDELFGSVFKIEASTATGWLEIANAAPSTERPAQASSQGIVRLVMDLTMEDPPLVACTPEIHGADWLTDAPVLRLTLHPQCRLFPLSLFGNPTLDPTLNAVALSVEVEGVKTLQAYNQQGQLDPSKPFQPFGPLPDTASYLVIASPEAARKSITRHVLTLDWAGLPAEGFGPHYAAYGAGSLTEDAFMVREFVLRDGQWADCGPDQPLFGVDREGELTGRPLVIEPTPLGANWRATEQPLVLDQNARSGFVKLQLSAPREGFGHQLYPSALTEALRPVRKGDTAPPLPNPPYTPTLNRVTLGYSAETRIVLADQRGDEADKVLHLHPFGVQTALPAVEGGLCPVLPRFGCDGQLLIGLSAPELQGELTLLFELREDIAVESLARSDPKPDIEWSVLMNDTWRPLDSRLIVADTTRGFLTSGIVKLVLPAGLTTGSRVLPADLFWLRLGSPALSGSFAGLQGVHAQAVRVTRVLADGPCDPLPPRSITNKSASIPGVLAIEQPEGGFGLRRAESETHTRVRIGERLRHKMRATTPWDYERLVLEQFPTVRKVRCLPNTHPRTGAPSRGDVLVVVVPDGPRNDPRYATRGLQLDALELDRIADYLPSLTSPFARVTVRNATYDLIQVRCRVALKEGAHPGDVLKRINSLLVSFLSPWSDGGYAADFDWSVRSDDVEACIRTVEEVDSVGGVSLIRVWEDNRIMANPSYQFEDTAVSSDIGIAKVAAIQAWSLALPLANHFIEVIDPISPSDEADRDTVRARPTGVAESGPAGGLGLMAGLQVGETFIIGGPS